MLVPKNAVFVKVINSSPGYLLFFNGFLLIYLELKIKDITQSEITNLVKKCPGKINTPDEHETLVNQ